MSDKNSSTSKNETKLENAISDMRRQLRGESKSEIIRQWIGLYAQVIQLTKELNAIREFNKKRDEASASEGKKDE